MKLAWSISWLLVAALMNPLCCCLAFATGHESATVAPHACCAAEQSAQPSDITTHDSDCPHQADKENKAFYSAIDTHTPPALVIGLWLGLTNQYPPADLQFAVSPLVASPDTHEGAPPGNHRLLCVYLI